MLGRVWKMAWMAWMNEDGTMGKGSAGTGTVGYGIAGRRDVGKDAAESWKEETMK
jgi:hypothetical protein